MWKLFPPQQSSNSSRYCGWSIHSEYRGPQLNINSQPILMTCKYQFGYPATHNNACIYFLALPSQILILLSGARCLVVSSRSSSSNALGRIIFQLSIQCVATTQFMPIIKLLFRRLGTIPVYSIEFCQVACCLMFRPNVSYWTVGSLLSAGLPSRLCLLRQKARCCN